MTKPLDRRELFVHAVKGGAGALLGGTALAGCTGGPSTRPAPTFPGHPPLEKVRIGYVGVGGMGSAHVRNLLKIEGAEIRAVCDIVKAKVERVQDWCVKAGRPRPEGYWNGEYDFKRLCEREDLDLVYTATPWRWHVPVCLEAMKNGKHAVTEVPAATTLADCWKLVEASERTGLYCIMMENCCYDRFEMMTLNLVRKGLLGELLHGEGGYLHDLRGLKFSKRGEGLWRLAHSIRRNADLYPTHGLGPVAWCMDINRGNKFDFLVSVATKSRGLNLFAARKYGLDSPQARRKYALGDIVTTTIKTARGETIVITHETDCPRPYSRNFLVQGTLGLARKYPDPKVYLEGRSPRDQWEEGGKYIKEFDHPVWKALEARSRGAGHGGMDFIEDYRLVQALLRGEQPDLDVYDAAAWSAVTELSERSIAGGSVPVKFPDFTRGAWKKKRPRGVDLLPENGMGREG